MLSFSFISLLGYSELLTSSLLTQGTLHKPLPLPEMLFPLAIYKVRSLHSLDVRLSVTSAERPSLTTHLKAVCPFTLYHSTQFIYRLSPSPGYKVYEGRNRVYLVEHCLSSAELKAWNVVGIKKKKSFRDDWIYKQTNKRHYFLCFTKKAIEPQEKWYNNIAT